MIKGGDIKMDKDKIMMIGKALGVSVDISSVKVSATANEMALGKKVVDGKTSTQEVDCLLATPKGDKSTLGVFTLINQDNKKRAYLKALLIARDEITPEGTKTAGKKSKSTFVVD